MSNEIERDQTTLKHASIDNQLTDKIKLNTKQKWAILQILLVLQCLTTKNSDRVLKRYKFRQDMSSSQLI